jgi:hypothetical protein
MVYVIDAWESRIGQVARILPRVDVLLMAYGDSIEHLKRVVPKKALAKIHLFPNFIVEPHQLALDKRYDMIQVGRRDEALHAWALKYAAEKSRSYLYERRDARGIYYFDGLPWETKRWQLSYDWLLDVLRQTRIALVSPPNRSNPVRTGSVSPLTHRYLEAATCGAIPVGSTPTGTEYQDCFPDLFTFTPKSYDEFVAVCDRLVTDEGYRRKVADRNFEYITENCTAAQRAHLLRAIIEDAYGARRGCGDLAQHKA